ncbi:MAG: dihydrolipoyl dehydrogenase [Chlorobium sp.]|uniref:dihydrolipoyl dehydrogenase n=1 Tax=Chlorobium sp. TaxID=1095 RepID=UPI001D52A280|nr:dihydrolipoyl dehydrogenase [Chlorobium sp.]MBN1278249.1 dihydrolipoyl dehydrogenase [Chlorobiaceae bacterium]MCF8215742.1 dihydrolipoyl dehydrogenase [Chlorobium sp.]MCF8270524.1 dihydrolipoyl dehydrogenase [Chlorobium sp.]MCF8286952.1 dihydrolipoyl dehydrogenase [Chlorobium sp.]MCF8290548.1 dihydrolipoyl dehydrogenase [Chlorobium sp.]
MQEQREKTVYDVDVAVIGSGPGGYEAALRSARNGLTVELVEKGAPGGVCVNWGCIPTKALLRSAGIYDDLSRGAAYGVLAENPRFDIAQAVKRSRNVVLKLSKGIEFMLRKAGVGYRQGEARITAPHEIAVFRDGAEINRFSARYIIVATGGRFRELPGLEPDGKRIITSKEALAMKETPGSMLVLGGGAIGIEMAWFFAKAGTNVTVVEMMPQILPLEDGDISAALRRSLEKAGISIHTSSRLEQVSSSEEVVTAVISRESEEPLQVSADCLLVAVGVTGNAEGLGLEASGVEIKRGFIVTDKQCRTDAGHIFAIGDVRGGMLLAHKASAEAAVAVGAIIGKPVPPVDETKIPACVYAEPSVASVGLTEAQATAAGYSLIIGRSMFAASGKANAYGSLDGLVKLIFNAADHRLLGAHLVGHGAVELVGQIGLARHLEVKAEDMAHMVYAHPTLSETIREAAENALG